MSRLPCISARDASHSCFAAALVPAHTSFEIVQIFRWYNGETDSYWLASAVIRDGQFAGKRILLPWGGFPGPYEERPWMADTACIADSLNVALTREGRYAATAMIDMVEVAQRTLDEADADTRQQLEQERAQVPAENQPHRLITDSDYAAKMQLVMQAEQDADHPDWFHTIANLVRADPRFLEINQEPPTWDRARDAGLPPTESLCTSTCYKNSTPIKKLWASTASGARVSSRPTSLTVSSTMVSSKAMSGHRSTPPH